MNYFDGIKFIISGSISNHTGFVDKRFSDYYGIQFNSYGDLLCAIEDQPLKLYHGAHAFITSPGIRFRYGSPVNSVGRGHSFVCFSGERIRYYIKSGLMRVGKGEVIKLSDGERFQLMLNELLRCLQTDYTNYPRAVNLLEGLLLEMIQSRQRPQESVPQQKIIHITEAMRCNSGIEWDFKKIATEMNISLAHFRRIFRQTIGQAPQHYLNEVRLQKAALLLCETNAPIKDIANQVGFHDRFYFSRCFRRQFNMPPATYRREFSQFSSTPAFDESVMRRVQ